MTMNDLAAKKEQAMRYLQENRWQDARTLFEEICVNQPDEPENWAYLGAISGRSGALADAVTCCHKAIALKPDHVAAHFNLGLALLASGKPGEAAASFRTAIRLDPNMPGAIDFYQQADLASAVGESLTVRITGDVAVCVPRSLQLMTPYILLEQEDWFEDEIVFVRRLMQPGMHALDIGANFGAYTLTMARRIGDSGKLWAFEPASQTASYLRRSIEFNGFSHVHLLQAALSDRKGTAELALEMNAELNSLTRAPGRAGATETVPVLTLDECALEFGWGQWRIDFVKLDAEGEEQNILRGGRDFLASQSPLIMFELKHGKVVNTGLIGLFQEQGYATYRLVPGLQLLAPFDESAPADAYQLNLFCCKPDRAESLERDGLLTRTASPSSPGEPAAGEGQAWLRARPYTGEFQPRWEPPLALRHPGWEQHRAAIDCYASVQRATLHPAARLAWLSRALVQAQAARAAQASIPRLMTVARIASDFGRRAVAVDALRILVDLLSGHAPAPLDEPFLAVSARFDALKPGGRDLEWCRAAALEQLEKLEAYSSYFSGLKASGRLDALAELPFTGVEMERRRQLVRMRHGQQHGLHPLLTAAGTEGCLNTAFWRGA